MKWRNPAKILAVLCVAGAVLTCFASQSPPPLPAGVLSDTMLGLASSASPVGFALLTGRGHQFVAYYDAERRMTVAGRTLDSTNWTYFRPPGALLPKRRRDSNVTEWDAHNYLALALDRDGYLHLSGNMHADPLIYYRSTRPFDVTSLERLDRMTGHREERTTYPVFFTNAAGDMIFRYRDGGSGNGSDIYNIYNPDTRTWRHLNATAVMDGEGRRNAYVSWPQLGPDGYFHFIWMWRETPDCSSNHTLSYARTRDFMHWENSRGKKLSLPITLGTGEVVDPAREKEGLINTSFSFGFDERQKPVVVYHRYDRNGNSQIYAARPSGKGGWKILPISDWSFRWDFSGSGSLPASIRLGVPELQSDGTFMVSYAMPFGPGSGRLRFAADTLRPLGALPPSDGLPSGLFERAWSTYPGMAVRTRISNHEGRTWVLRWESLPANRDVARSEVPPPCELHLYEMRDSTK
ncbi:MAG: hypothetical protein RLY20_2230 [Verrucomicrobiota bacterium]|jgi:hypothetical protein